MKNDKKSKAGRSEVPDLMFQNVTIPEALAPLPINPALDSANQLILPRNPGPTLHALDWEVPNEPLVTDDEAVPPTPNPHTAQGGKRKKTKTE